MNDAKVFVRGIPVELENDGLYNIFIKAGPISDVRIIPPKDPSHPYTFGFVTFQHATAASTAVEMFNNYRIAGRYLAVQISSSDSVSGNSNSSRREPTNNEARTYIEKKTKKDLNTTDDGFTDIHDLSTDALRSDSIKRTLAGRGSIIRNHDKKETPKRGQFNLSRPYARHLSSSRSLFKSQSSVDTELDLNNNNNKQIIKEEFIVGQKYKVNLTHVTTPSNFFIQLVSSVQKTANLMMNMDNHYKNEMSAKEDKFYTLERGAIRCKLSNLIPANGCKQWSHNAWKILNDIKNENQNEILLAEVISCEDFENGDRFEKIYGIDLFFGGKESIINYMIDEKIGVEVFDSINKENEPEPITSKPAASITNSGAPLSEKSTNPIEKSVTIKSEPQKVITKPSQHPSSNSVVLKKGTTYKVNLIYFDEQLIEQEFYVSRCDQSAKEKMLSEKLQEPCLDCTQMIKDISCLKSGDKVEALFDIDDRWYRASVDKITNDSVQVYFLDYGNSETYSADQVSNKLRVRSTNYKNIKEKELLTLDYQAIRCVYSTDNNKTLEDFITKLSEEIEEVENGFEITIKEVVARDIDALSYRIILACEEPDNIVYAIEEPIKSVVQIFKEDLSGEKRMNSETEADHEVSSILEENDLTLTESIHKPSIHNNLNNIELELNKDHSVSICHIDNTNEFYVQLAGNLKELMEHFQRIQVLAELEQPKSNADVKHQVGDLVLARYLVDDTWYKGLITKIDDKTGLYEVYFVDYGNTEGNNSPVDLRSMNALYEIIRNKQELIDELNSIIEFPFQAICCQLENKKTSIRNTEILKTLVTDCFNFDIKTKSVTTQKICELVEIKKNVVNLYSEDKLLDVNFEDQIIETKPIETQFIQQKEKFIEQQQPKTLQINSVHDFKTAFFGGETEIHLHLANECEALEKLHEQLNSKEHIENLEALSFLNSNIKVNDIVIAKFYEEDRVAFSWYRAKIDQIDSDNKFTVSYIDYGNSDTDLTINDLCKLTDKFSIKEHPQYSYKVQLNKITLNLELENHIEALTECLGEEGFKFKVISYKDGLYDIELWDNKMQVCYNKLIDESYSNETVQVKPIEEKSLIKEEDKNLLSECPLKTIKTDTVLTKSMYGESYQKPFYFCLEKDLLPREELKAEMNEFYKTERDDLNNLIPDEYCVVFSQDSWYRAQLIQTTTTTTTTTTSDMFIYYIDFGFEEPYSKDILIKVLDKKFEKFPRYAFGASLVNMTHENKDFQTTIQIEESEDLNTVFEEFLAPGLDDHKLIIKSKLINTNSDIYVKNVIYYGIHMYNIEGSCLNEQIELSRQKKTIAKQPRPDLIKLDYNMLPKQSTDKQIDNNEIFMLFTRRINLFYIFEQKRVKLIQQQIQDICNQINEEQQNYKIEPEQEVNVFKKGDLVFGKLEADQAWYRCIITNCNKTRTKFELFFFDFGNTEIVTKDDILYGWNEDHVNVFKMYEPQALKCKLYGLVPINGKNDFSDEENEQFKKFISDNSFNVRLVKYEQEEDIFEVSMTQLNGNQISVNSFVQKNQLATYDNFDNILKQIKCREEAEFFIEQIEMLNLKQYQFL